ncbi:hypothetical protein [Streptomyces decoyicus]|uniref:hypothetical protein n=1 Tax=Streptomyces decoyicus TaxID=249567 RepID=UPI00386353C4
MNASASELCFVLLPSRWAIVGMAASYGLAVTIGSAVAWRRLRRQPGGDLDGTRMLRTYARLTNAAALAALVVGGAAWALLDGLGSNALGSLVALLAGAAMLLGVFVGLAGSTSSASCWP